MLPSVGPLELVIVLVIALLVVGPRRLPEMGNAVGKTIREFRKASTEVSEAVSLEPQDPAKTAPAPLPDTGGEVTPKAMPTPTEPATVDSETRDDA